MVGIHRPHKELTKNVLNTKYFVSRLAGHLPFPYQLQFVGYLGWACDRVSTYVHGFNLHVGRPPPHGNCSIVLNLNW